MKIDITQLTEQELISLNRQIVERIRFLQQMRTHNKMLEFQVGDRVSFQPHDRALLFGVLVRHNKKTVSIITDNGERWNVSPTLIQKVVDVTSSQTEATDSNVIKLPRK